MIQSKLLTQLGIVHGYSTRNVTREKFLEGLGVKGEDMVMGQQVHGIKIATVNDSDRGKILTGIDGLISKTLPIGVTFADCVPVLAVDPQARIIGAVHAGWKGTLGGIARDLISEMKKAGAEANKIYVSIGPHIGMCCYNIMDDRVAAFQKQFGEEEKIAARIEGAWHLDIGYANYQLLIAVGVQKEHIDAPPTCTSCQVAEFNSYRKDSKETFGVQIGVIAL